MDIWRKEDPGIRRVIFILIFAIGFFLRIFKLGYDDLWFDEVCSMQVKQHLGVSSRLFGLSPLYYLFLHFWLIVFANNEFWMRLPSVLFSSISLLGIFILAKYLWDEKAAFFALAMLSLSPFHIWYAQEATRYSLVVVIFIFDLYVFLKSIRNNRFQDWFLLVLFSILGVYCDYFFILVILCEVIILFFLSNKKVLKHGAISFLIVGISFLPWVNSLKKNLDYVSSGFWPPIPSVETLFATFADFNLGYTSSVVLYRISLVISFYLFISAFLYAEDRKKRNELIFLSLLFLLPILLIFILGHKINIFLPRVLIIFSIPYYLVMSYGLKRLWDKKIFIVVSIFFLLFLNPLFNYYQRKMPAPFEYHIGVYIKKPIKPIIRYLEENWQEGDVIIHTNPQTHQLFDFYGGENIETHSYYFLSKAQDRYWKDKLLNYRGPNWRRIIPLGQVKKLDFERIWLVSSSWARDGSLDDNSKFVRVWFQKHYKKINGKWSNGILIELYQRKKKK